MIKDWQSYNPVKIISGVGCINKLNTLVETGNWLLVTSPGFTKRGYPEQLKSKLSNINLFVFDKVSPNPELEELESMTNFYRNKSINQFLIMFFYLFNYVFYLFNYVFYLFNYVFYTNNIQIILN